MRRLVFMTFARILYIHSAVLLLLGLFGCSLETSIEDIRGSAVINVANTSITEGDTGAVSISLSRPFEDNIVLSYTVTDVNAVQGTDYSSLSGTITIPAESTVASIDISTIDDSNYEVPETFVVTFLSPGLEDLSLGTQQVTVTIQDDESLPQIEYQLAANNDSENTANPDVVIKLSGPAQEDITFDYSITGGTATASGTDFTLASGSLTIAGLSTLITIQPTIVDDGISEADETITFNISNPSSNAEIGSQSTHTFTINDNDGLPDIDFSLAASSVTEGTATTAVVVQLSNPSSTDITFNYSVTAGTAVQGSGSYDDLNLPAASMTISAMSTLATISVPINDDIISESSETATITVASPSANAEVGVTNPSHVLTINDNDGLPDIEYKLATGSTAENGGNASVELVLSNPSSSAITVDYTFPLTGTATGSGTDYTSTSSTVTFATMTTALTISVPLNDDTIFESDETFDLALSSKSANADYGTQVTHTHTITENDSKPSVQFVLSADSTSEDVAGGEAYVVASLSHQADTAVTVDYSVSGGSATGGGVDYTLAADTLTFSALSTLQTLTIAINNETLYEADETVIISLSNNSSANSSLGTPSQHTHTILNDEAKPVIQWSSATGNTDEDEGTGNALIVVELDITSFANITVDYAITGGDAINGSSGTYDYTLGVGTLTVSSGSTLQTLTVPLHNDNISEGAETFEVTLSNNSSNSTLGASNVHTHTINDDEAVPEIEYTLAADNTDEDVAAGEFVVDLKLSHPSSTVVTVDVSTTGGTATGGTDYTWTNPTTVTFSAMSTALSVTVPITNDGVYEGNETVDFGLSSASVNSTVGTQSTHTHTINDDESAPTVQFALTTSNESEDVAGAEHVVEVTLSHPMATSVTVDYALSGGDALGAGVDYTLADGTLTFSALETTKSLTISFNDDVISEVDETQNITLSNPMGGISVSVPSVHTFTILDDDGYPNIQFALSTDNTDEDEADGDAEIVIQLSNPSSSAITVEVAVTGGTAVNGGVDYTWSSPTTVTFSAMSTLLTIEPTINNETLSEADETFDLLLQNPSSNSTVGAQSTHIHTINNDEALPEINFVSTADSTVENVAGGTKDIVVSLDIASSSAVTVDYAAADITATSGDDYSLTAGTLTFAAGSTLQTITLSVTDDNITEADETLSVTLSNQSVNATIGASSVHTHTITNDEALPVVTYSLAAASTFENAGTASIVVQLDRPSSVSTTVDYTVADNTAVGGGVDYTLAAGTLTFAALSTTATISATLNNDMIYEAAETFDLGLTAPSNLTIGAQNAHAHTITNDDAKPNIQFQAASDSTLETTTPTDIVLVLSHQSSTDVTFDFAVSGGTATGGSVDYTLADGSLTISAMGTLATISMVIDDDTITEGSETVVLNISNPSSNAILGTQTSHTHTITDDEGDPEVEFNLASSSVAENVAGASHTVEVILSNASTSMITVGYSAADNTANGSGVDYTLNSGTLVFLAGETTKSLTISINNDDTYESNETFNLNLASPSNSTLGSQSSHQVTINDNDAPSISYALASSSVAENVGSAEHVVNIELSNISDSAITVDYSVTGGTATGTGTDYTLADGTATVAAGNTIVALTLSIDDDAIYEGAETIDLDISNPIAGVSLGGQTTHQVTINDNESKPAVNYSLANANTVENVGGGNALVVLELDREASVAVTVDYAVTGGTASGSGVDYTLADGTLTFAANTTLQTLTIAIVDEGIYEADETIDLNISSPSSNLNLGAQTTHTHTITNDDGKPNIEYSLATDATVEGSGPALIVVDLSHQSSTLITADYSVTGGTATGSGTDYTLAAGTVTISAMGTLATISVPFNNDSIDEADETFALDLTNPSSNATIGTQSTHTHTITDDDAAPEVEFSLAADSSSEAVGNALVVIELNKQSASEVTVGYSVNGSSSATGTGTDYTLANGTATIAAMSTLYTITMPINNDSIYEGSETVILDLASPGNATLGTNSQHIHTINDNETLPAISYAAAADSTAEDVAGGSALVVLSMDKESSSAVTVDYAVTGGTATGTGTDYTLADGTATISAGNTLYTLTIPITDDDIYEPNETIALNISNPSTYAVLGSQTTHTHTITEDDSKPTIQYQATTGNTNENAGPAQIVVELSHRASVNITASYSVTGGDATQGSSGNYDYTLAGGTITVSAMSTLATLSVPLNDDSAYEGAETFDIDLSSPSAAATLGTNTAHTHTINDNETQPTVQYAAATSGAVENAGPGLVVLTLSAAAEDEVTVVYGVTGGTATSGGTDYTAPAATTVTFAAYATTKTLSFTYNDDLIVEDDETITLNISSPNNATLGGQTTHTHTITDNEATPDVEFTLTTDDTDEDVVGGNAVINVNLSAQVSSAVTVDYAISGGSAVENASGPPYDYTLADGTLTFAIGATSMNLTVPIFDDSTYEGAETFVITLSNQSVNAVLGTNTSHTHTINDNETKPNIQYAAASGTIAEDDAGGEALVVINLSGAVQNAVTVNYAVTGGTATGGGTDYTAPAATTLTFASLETTKTLTFTLNDDTIYEGSETFALNISNPSADATIGTQSTHTHTITDDDTKPTIQYQATSGSTNENTGPTAIIVELSHQANVAVTASYSVTGGDATEGSSGTWDYTLSGAAGVVTIPALSTLATIALPINDDSLYEGNETVVLDLTSPSAAATLGTNTSHTHTINDNETQPTIQYSAATSNKAENVGPGLVVISLSVAAEDNVTFDYSVTGGTATGGGTDYTAPAGSSLTFSGTTLMTLTFPYNDDLVYEGDETITLNISNPSANATLGTQTTHTHTINENESKPTLQYAAASASTSENDASGEALVVLNLSGETQADVTFNYSVTGGSATGSGTDYTAPASATHTISGGATVYTLTFTLNDDLIYEGDEDIDLNISSPSSNITIGAQSTHTHTITENDSKPSLQFAVASDNTDEDDADDEFYVVLNLSGETEGDVTFNYSVSGSSTATGGGTDYTAPASATQTISGGSTVYTMTFPINDDAINEADETVILSISSPSSNAFLGTQTSHTHTINDNDNAGQFQFALSSSSVAEDVAGGNAYIVVDLTNAMGVQTTVDYAVNGSSTATGGGTDYTLTDGTLTFAIGETVKTLTVAINNDTDAEPAETYIVDISSPTGTGASLGSPTQHTLTINDNDDFPETKIKASDGADSDWLGVDVVINDEIVVIGAFKDDDNGNDSGSVYVNKWNGSAWVETKLTASDGAAGDKFGTSVAVSGDRIVVGATHDQDNGYNSGSAYVYDWNGSSWDETKLVPSDGDASDAFGYSVAIDGDTIVVGANEDEENGSDAGSVYVFRWDGSSWIETKLMASDGAAGAIYGEAVAVSGDTVAVGAPGDDDNGTFSGSVYVYKWNGSSWVESKIKPTDGVASDYFGMTVSVSGDRVASGANGNDDNGSSSGSAYVFKWNGGSWDETKILPSDGSANDNFGIDVSINGDSFVVGAWGDSAGGANSGSAYWYNWDGASWDEVKVVASDPAASEFFGNKVSISGERFVISKTGDNDNGTNSGSVYIYETASNEISDPVLIVRDNTSGSSILSNALTVDIEIQADSIATKWCLSETQSTKPANTTTDCDGGAFAGTEPTSYTFGSLGFKTLYIWNADSSDNINNAKISKSIEVVSSIPVISVADASITEGSAASVIVSLNGDSATDVVFDWATTDNTATTGDSDYTGYSWTTVTIAPGDTLATISIGTGNDTKYESDENFVVSLNPVSNCTAGDITSSVTIEDNDSVPTISVNDGSVTENSTANVVVELSNATDSEVVFEWATSDNTALAASDYSAQSLTSVTISAGATLKTVNVNTTDNSIYEEAEDFVVTINPLSNATAGDLTASITINDDDTKPDLEFAAASGSTSEDDGDGEFYVVVQLSGVTQDNVTFNYSVTGGTATGSGTDYTAPASATHTISGGSTLYTLTFPINNDSDIEAAETVILSVSSPSSNANLGTQTSHTHSILDNDTYPETIQVSSDVASGDKFGSSVARDDNIIVVGATYDDDAGSSSGSVYVYKWNGSSWDETKLTASDAAANNYFGQTVDISGDRIVVGTKFNKFYVYTWNGSSWDEEIVISSDIAAGDSFGEQVAISGDTIVAGSRGNAELGANAGAIYVYKWNGSAWEEEKLLASDGVSGEQMGASVAISGDTIVTGARFVDTGGFNANGAAYVFKWDGTSWVETKLLASDRDDYDYFGFSVAVSGDRIVVGAQYDDTEGSAYLFEWNGSSWDETKFMASDGDEDYEFGNRVAISGRQVFVGASGAYTWQGRVYQYTWNGSSWDEIAITGSDTVNYDSFSNGALYAYGEQLLVGSGDAGTGGKIYQYDLQSNEMPDPMMVVRDSATGSSITSTSHTVDVDIYEDSSATKWCLSATQSTQPVDTSSCSGSSWVGTAPTSYTFSGDGFKTLYVWHADASDNINTNVFSKSINVDTSLSYTKLMASDSAAGDQFGGSVAISDNTIVIGSASDDDNGTDSGSAYVYKWNGSSWVETKLTASDGADSDAFGLAVAVSGETIVVGAPKDDDNGSMSGSAYIYRWNGASWVETKITASDGAGMDYYGYSVATSGDTVVVGAFWDDDTVSNSGSIYIYKWNGSSWAETKLQASDPESSSDYGFRVAIDGDIIVVGARYDDSNGSDSGSAYIYKWNGSSWDETKLTPSDGDSSDNFGSSVAISGETIVVGADKAFNDYKGKAYIYKWNGSGWDETILTASDGVGYDNFGGSVGISGDHVIVGARGVDNNGDYAGASYYYNWNGSSWVESKQAHSEVEGSDYNGYSASASGYWLLSATYRSDENGTSSGSTYVYNTLSNQMPAPVLMVRDSSSGSSITSDNLTVDLVIKADSRAAKWCVSETQSTRPADTSTCAGGSWVSTKPTSYTFGSIGFKKLYIWHADGSDVISKDIVSKSINVTP